MSAFMSAFVSVSPRSEGERISVDASVILDVQRRRC